MLFGTDQPAVVMDNGTGMLKVGYAGEMEPRAVVPTILGRPKPAIDNGLSRKSKKSHPYHQLNANSCMNPETSLTLSYPMVNGVVDNWNDMEILWQHVFNNELRIETENHPLLITETPQNPKSNREKLCELLFEKFQMPALHISIQSILTLYASGRTTGLVLDCGEGVTTIVPIFDAFVIPQAMHRRNLGGLDVTNYLKSLLNERGYQFVTTCEHEIARNIKENVCYVSMEYEKELLIYNNHKRNTDISYPLPDGQLLKIGSERIRASELLFNPRLDNFEYNGIHQAIKSAIFNCGLDVRKSLWSNIILCGGSTMFPGFSDRIYNELIRIAPVNTTIKVHCSPERKYTVWIGGAVLASLSTFNDMWVLKAEYDECGIRIVNQKCI